MPPSSPPASVLVVVCLLLGCGPAPTPGPAPVGLGAAAAAAAAPPASPARPAASPAPSAEPTVGGWREGDVIAFEAPQAPGAANRDLFLYQAREDTVLAFVGANTAADEASPRLSRDRRWLAFTRTVTGPDGRSRTRILLLDTVRQLLDGLPRLNAGQADQTDPHLSGDGRWIAHVSDGARLGLYDRASRTELHLVSAERGFTEVRAPRLFDGGRRLAFSASVADAAGRAGTRDIYLYDVATGGLWRPPFVNTGFNEDNPDLTSDGTRMVFDSDRFGSRDLFEADLATGVTRALAFANTAAFDERSPRYYGRDDAWVRFKLYPAPSAAPEAFLLRVCHPRTGALDTLSVPNRLLAPAAVD